MIQEGLLFKENQLCIPKFSMRDNLLKENNSGALVGHFSHEKTFGRLSNSYYLPGMRKKVESSNMKKVKYITLDCIINFQYQRVIGMQ
jgi:hypothetical protein